MDVVKGSKQPRTQLIHTGGKKPRTPTSEGREQLQAFARGELGKYSMLKKQPLRSKTVQAADEALMVWCDIETNEFNFYYEGTRFRKARPWNRNPRLRLSGEPQNSVGPAFPDKALELLTRTDQAGGKRETHRRRRGIEDNSSSEWK